MGVAEGCQVDLPITTHRRTGGDCGGSQTA
jgi:hypothetical protein